MNNRHRDAAGRFADEFGIPRQGFFQLIGAESSWDPRAHSPRNAYGYTQLLPGTARGLGVNPRNPIQNLRGGAKYLAAQFKRFGRWDLALAAYNAGPNAVAKYGGIPPYAETQRYVKKLLPYFKGKKGQKARAALAAAAGTPGHSERVSGDYTVQEGLSAADADTLNTLFENVGLDPVLTAGPTRTVRRSTNVNFPGRPGTPGRPGRPGAIIRTRGYPLGSRGNIIGTPHAGTHTLGNWQSDNAVDISVPVGTPMVIREPGVVVKVTRHPQNGGRFAGDQITVRGRSGQMYFFAHGTSSVKAGQRLKANQTIGRSGSANGVPHLHYGVMRGDPRATLKRPKRRKR